ncbi:MAG TPA: Plug domain-containing protein [Gammaproteobacteria bacterium]|nr:Plug domain-containing protein [Gammaproteobacteria bacterium]
MSAAEVSSSVQIIIREELQRSEALTLQDALQQFPGVYLNNQQGNSSQLDVSFRGFTRTSMTGIPQWMSPFLLLVHLIMAVPMRDPSAKTCFIIGMAQKEGLRLFHIFMN